MEDLKDEIFTLLVSEDNTKYYSQKSTPKSIPEVIVNLTKTSKST